MLPIEDSPSSAWDWNGNITWCNSLSWHMVGRASTETHNLWTHCLMQVKILHRRHYSKVKLHKICPAVSPICHRCPFSEAIVFSCVLKSSPYGLVFLILPLKSLPLIQNQILYLSCWAHFKWMVNDFFPIPSLELNTPLQQLTYWRMTAGPTLKCDWKI